MSDMHQLEFFNIANPCIGVCTSGKRGFCQGCFRSRDERQHWQQLPENIKYQILQACSRRQLRQRRSQKAPTDDSNATQQTDLFE